MSKSVAELKYELLDSAEQHRSRRLSRGNVRLQRGELYTQRQWDEMKELASERLARATAVLCPSV